MICECYRAEKNFLGGIGLCWGSQERNACSCGGDKSKCDFYPTVREEVKKPITNADLIRAMTDEELARWITNELIEPGYYDDEHTYELWLGWLRQEVKDGKQDQSAP